ncbi:MAG: pyridoxal-phosphate dependent enzyme [Sphaerochaetaceae bacterium]|nr:pyridoxal-phosphate dependent enzyme [Sphaerochaetaceae bacterium]
MRFWYECNDCHETYNTDTIMYRCPKCQKTESSDSEFSKGNLIVRFEKDDLKRLSAMQDLCAQDFLPYDIPDIACYPVGPTPLVYPKRLGHYYGLNSLSFKLDSALLSGSFKDRASQLVAAQAITHNEHVITLASTGNAGAAMSCAGAAYGLDVVLFVPEKAPVNKLMQSILYGATVVPVRGTYDDAFALSIAYTDKFGGINRNTAYNPMTIEGKKTVSIELFLQLGKALPDIIYVPVGDGCIFAGVYKGFYDLREAGLIDKIPHLVCVQSDSSHAISQAWRTRKFESVKATTQADSINVSLPANGRMAVRYIDESNGWAIEVSDSELFDAQRELAKESGIFVEPAAACAWAGARKDAPDLRRRFKSNCTVCVLLTGIGFKDMAVFDKTVRMPAPIDNSIEAMTNRFS